VDGLEYNARASAYGGPSMNSDEALRHIRAACVARIEWRDTDDEYGKGYVDAYEDILAQIDDALEDMG